MLRPYFRFDRTLLKEFCHIAHDCLLEYMQTTLTNKDRAAFRAANEQRKTDREALEQLRKTDRQSKSPKTPPASP